MLIGATLLVAIALLALVYIQTPWGALPTEIQVAPANADFTAAEIDGAHAFRTTLRWLSVSSLVAGLIFISLLGFTSIGKRLIEKLPGGPVVQTMLGVLLITAMMTLVRLPFSIASERIARREGLSSSTWSLWLVDLLKSSALTVTLIGGAFVMVGMLARWRPGSWWAVASLGAAMLTLVLSFIFPVVVEPIFNRFTPMPAGELRTSLLELAERDQVPASEVLVADASRRTTALNAYVSGFGATRRIVVYDTLLQEAPESEVRMVVAHELGHAKARDVLSGTVLGALVAAIAVLLLALVLGSRVGAPGSIALIMALFAWFSLIQQPAAGVISRSIEARADLHALELTRDPEVFATMQRRLALTNRADVIAPRWSYLLFASHPSTRERIALARWWAEREALPIPEPMAK